MSDGRRIVPRRFIAFVPIPEQNGSWAKSSPALAPVLARGSGVLPKDFRRRNQHVHELTVPWVRGARLPTPFVGKNS